MEMQQEHAGQDDNVCSMCLQGRNMSRNSEFVCTECLDLTRTRFYHPSGFRLSSLGSRKFSSSDDEERGRRLFTSPPDYQRMNIDYTRNYNDDEFQQTYGTACRLASRSPASRVSSISAKDRDRSHLAKDTNNHTPDMNEVDLHFQSDVSSEDLIRPTLEKPPLYKDRTAFCPRDTVEYLWRQLGLSESSLSALEIFGDQQELPSSYKVGHLAHASIALSALAASLVRSIRTNCPVSRVTVPLRHAAIEFKSEKLYTIGGQPPIPTGGTIGGLHKTSDGYVRVHDSFPNHRSGTARLFGYNDNATRDQIAAAISKWTSIDLETTAIENDLVISALRTPEQWDQLPQARAIADIPILIRKIANGPVGLPFHLSSGKPDKCLRGLRVLEMSRVIAAPVAGRTLAAHGADVLWVTSPNLPDLPFLDRDLGRGKRTTHIDINNPTDVQMLHTLLEDADVFIQGFRPGSLAAKGLSASALAISRQRDNRHGIICANLSAYGPDGPWSHRRGFDSLVQTCSGMNVSEAELYGAGEPARPLPCQALDHGAGYFLATGIMAALYRQATEGGSYEVDVSLAGVMKYLKSLGQYPGRTGFDCRDYESVDKVPVEYLETRQTEFGEMVAVKHSARIDGVDVGWDIMPKPLGSDEPRWL